ncbi:RimJ/RimL family protein N-acetyltransferase, partial [Streptomyces cavourensis]
MTVRASAGPTRSAPRPYPSYAGTMPDPNGHRTPTGTGPYLA